MRKHTINIIIELLLLFLAACNAVPQSDEINLAQRGSQASIKIAIDQDPSRPGTLQTEGAAINQPGSQSEWKIAVDQDRGRTEAPQINEPATVQPETQTSSEITDDQSSALTKTPETTTQISLIVSPAPVLCIGAAPGCLQVKFEQNEAWEPMRGEIAGFEYEPGYRYVLLVEETDHPNSSLRSADTKYQVVEIIEKTEAAIDPEVLENTAWELIKFGNISQPNSASGLPRVTFRYDQPNNKISGQSACNFYSGDAYFNGALLEADIDLIGSTKMACSGDALDLEHTYLDLLGRVESYSLDNNTLYMFTSDGKMLAFVQGKINIILFIGDGMGPVHRQAASWYRYGLDGTLVMDSLPDHGIATTTSASSPVTDSAAAATAMATGIQTNNGVISIDIEGVPRTTILEYAQATGLATGLVTTVQVTHATPAAFASHVPSRTDMVGIGSQIMDHKINVLLGGGEDYFYSPSEEGCYPGMGNQTDNLVQEAIDFGYTYVCTPDQFNTLNLTSEDYLLGLFSGEEMTRPFQPSLSQMTTAAIEVLSHDPDGFFLMIEAGQIDWAAHSNDAENAMISTLGLDDAIRVAETYAAENPNTLLIVTADHETGGMSLSLDGVGSSELDGPFEMPDGTQFWVDWSTTGHTATPVPVTAFGKDSDLLQGEYHLTYIFDVLYQNFYLGRP